MNFLGPVKLLLYACSLGGSAFIPHCANRVGGVEVMRRSGRELQLSGVGVEELKALFRAREAATQSVEWQFKLYYLGSDGQVVDHKGEAAAEPSMRGRLAIDGSKKVISFDDQRRGLDVAAYYDGERLLARYTPRQDSGLGSIGAKETFEENGRPHDYFVKGYLPNSFGIGVNGQKLSEWLSAASDLHEIGVEEVAGRECSIYLVLSSVAGNALQPAALIWVDLKESLLVMRFQSLTPATGQGVGQAVNGGLVTKYPDLSKCRVMSQWEVAEISNLDGVHMPSEGRFRLFVESPFSEIRLSMVPRIHGVSIGSAESEGLGLYSGAIIRDAVTGTRRTVDTDGELGVRVRDADSIIALLSNSTREAARAGSVKQGSSDGWVGASCGTVAAYMLLGVHGFSADLAQMSSNLGDSPGSAQTMASLKREIESGGLKVKGYSLSVEALKSLGPGNQPFLMHLASKKGEVGHYVLALAEKDGIQYYDPTAESGNLPYEVVDVVFEGRATVLLPGDVLLDGEGGESRRVAILVALVVGAALAVSGGIRLLARKRAKELKRVAGPLILLCIAATTGCSHGVEAGNSKWTSLGNSPLSVNGDSSVDFGERPYGEEVSHTLVIRNEGQSPAKIHNVRSSCGCTSAAFSAEELLPGEEGALDIVLSMDVAFRAAAKVMLVGATSEGEFVAPINVSARLERKDVLVADRNALILERATGSGTFDVHLYYPEAGVSMLSVGEHPVVLSVSVAELNSGSLGTSPGRRTWRVQVQPRDGELTSSGEGVIVLTSDIPEVRPVRIPVSWMVTSALSIEVAEWMVGMGLDAVVTHSFELRACHGQEKLRCASEAPWVTCDLSELGYMKIAVTPSERQASGFFRATVVTTCLSCNREADLLLVGSTK